MTGLEPMLAVAAVVFAALTWVLCDRAERATLLDARAAAIAPYGTDDLRALAQADSKRAVAMQPGRDFEALMRVTVDADALPYRANPGGSARACIGEPGAR